MCRPSVVGLKSDVDLALDSLAQSDFAGIVLMKEKIRPALQCVLSQDKCREKYLPPAPCSKTDFENNTGLLRASPEPYRTPGNKISSLLAESACFQNKGSRQCQAWGVS